MQHVENAGSSRAAVGTILIADPFIERTAPVALRLCELGYDVIRCTTLGDATSMCLNTRPDFVLSELRFPDGSGMALIRWIASHLPSTKIVVHTWFADIPTAVAATKAGGSDLVPKPTDQEFLISILLFGTDKVPHDCRIETPQRVRREHVEEIMRISGSNVSDAARKLQLDRRSLQRMLKRFEADAPQHI
jgi:two-component system response regulator RegA